MRRSTILALALLAGATGVASAQCCGQPTVAYSPVVAAPAPAVVQTTTVNEGWYPGKYIANFSRNLFGSSSSTTTYTAGYAPTAYTAGYAPTSYSVGYAPSTYTAGYAPTYQTAYRPVYPATWGPVTYAPAPLTQTVSRPVVLSPIVAAPACGGCGACSACDACSGGVSQAAYAAPSTGCSSCAGGASYEAPLSGSSNYYEPQPSLAPGADVPETRGEQSIRQKPEADADADFPAEFDDDTFDNRTEGDPAAANEYWRAPPLFAPPSNRVTRNTHPAPVQNAVYRRPAGVAQTAYRPAGEPAKGRVNRLSSDGWGSAN